MANPEGDENKFNRNHDDSMKSINYPTINNTTFQQVKTNKTSNEPPVIDGSNIVSVEDDNNIDNLNTDNNSVINDHGEDPDDAVVKAAVTSWRPAPRPSLTADERAEAKEAYLMFDLEATGKMKIRPLKMAFRALGIKITKKQVAELMNEVADQDPGGWVTRSQFIDMFALVIDLRDVRQEICKAFGLFDQEGTGSISFRNIKRVAVEVGEDLTDAEIEEIILGVDKNGDGVIRKSQFENAIGKSGGDTIDDLDSD